MLLKKLWLWLLALQASALTTGAEALEFSVHANASPTLNAVMAEGLVEDGDVERLWSFLLKQPPKTNTAVYLASPGGSLYEGMALGLFFMDRGIRTVVEGGRDCASACALAFLGGRDNAGQPWRSSSSNSRLGFHAFSTAQPVAGDDVQRIVADVLAYGQLVDAPLQLLILAFSTPSNGIYWLSEAETCGLGIKLWSNVTDSFVC